MLEIPDEIRAEMAECCRVGYPEEVCGLLLGSQAGPLRRVSRLHAVKNVSPTSRDRRFVLDPEGFLAADVAARARQCEIIGTYHSHPDRPAEPSTLDEEQAQPGWSHVILSVSGTGVGPIRSHELVVGVGGEARLVEEEMVAEGEET